MAFMTLPPNTSNVQLDEMRKAFFAGAQHLFASIMGILEPGAEPTEKDLVRMDHIDKELREFVSKMKAELDAPSRHWCAICGRLASQLHIDQAHRGAGAQ